ncbi:hypothetical protein CDV31_002389 [Fusarium ambrosium]|uniref:Uncharacterized protein n=1 Tax=Fusarium ambrosium TaxID=131363 RepID=A0A428UWJ2_9HYPO|nr:hypothetical protein CDV31_002389 [Fusarium ambrosium]
MRLKDLVRRGKEPLPAPSSNTDVDPASTVGSSQPGPKPIETSLLHESHGQPQDEDKILKQSTWANLWAEAYQTVKDDPEHSHLLEAFEACLQEGKRTDSADAPSITELTVRLGLIQKLAREKLEGLSEAHLTFSLCGRRIVVRNAVLKAVKLISAFKPIIDTVVATEPHAALAWAGVLTLLPMLENLFQQEEDAANGLTNILFLLIRYQGIQESILATEFEDASQPETTRRLLSSIRTKLVSVYAQVYIYQIRFVQQYARGKIHRVLRNSVSADGWKQMWSEIESTSCLIDQGVQDRLGVRALETWRRVSDIEARTQRIESLQQATLAAVQTGNEAELLLSLPFAANAIFDSAETLGADAPCLPGTQQRILSEIQDWAESPNGEAIFWLHGMAGTGKTSVALTVANALNEREPFTAGGTPPSTAFLGASFFFKQGDATRNSTRGFFPTLARCLAEVFPDLKSHIVSAINDRLAIGTKAPPQQLRHLIVEPLSVLDDETFLPVRLVVVVDALDECLKQTEAEELIEMLATLEQLHQVQLRLLITSRRDKHLLGSFERLPSVLYRPLLLDKVQASVEKDESMDDITLYISHTLARIADKHGVSQDWIDEAEIHKLCQKADGLFIYAATVCRFIDAEDFADEEARQERLEQIFDDEGEADSPQQKVDEIYLKVLSFPHLDKSTKKTRERIFARTGTVLGFLAVLFEPVSVSALGLLAALSRETLDGILRQLNSIVSIPQDEKAPLGLVHLSFRDFILSEERSKPLQFRVQEAEMHRHVLRRCLDIMSSELCQDICRVVSPGKLASEVPRCQIEQSIPQHLGYACRYWVDHLAELHQDCRLEAGLSDTGEIHTFLKERFLYWLEAMSLIGETPTIITIINQLQDMISPSDHPGLSSFAYDAKRFVLANRWVIEHAPVQIYSSALIFSPQSSVIRLQFADLIPCWITQKPTTEENWTPMISTLGDNYLIRCVSFSPTEDLVAFATGDGIARLWDYTTGTERFKFEGPDVQCVSFSADGKMIAIGSEDGVLEVRDFAKDKVIELRGHRQTIDYIAFSPRSSAILASVGQDGERFIWNVDEGRIICSLPGLRFSGPVAFSEDSRLACFAGLKGDPSILMSVETGECTKISDAEEDKKILITALSVDGQTMATATVRTVTIKDLSTGTQRSQGPFGGIVKDMAFSPDGNVLALVIDEVGIRLHDVDTWEVIGGRYLQYGPVAFCRDGKTIGSGGGRGLLLWDTSSMTNGLPMKEPKNVRNLMFLPGGNNLVLSYSDDEDPGDPGIWDMSGGHVKPQLLTLALKERSIPDVFVSQDCTRMALMGLDKLRMFDMEKLEETWVLDVELSEFMDLGFSPDGQFIWHWDHHQFRIWDLEIRTPRLLLALKCSDGLGRVSFSPDGQLVALTWLGYKGQDGAVQLIEMATGRERGILPCHPFYIPTFHPDSQLIVSVKNDGPITGWNTKCLSEKFSLEGTRPKNINDILSLIMTPTGKLVVLKRDYGSGAFPTVHLWDTTTGKEIGSYGIGGWPGETWLSDAGRSLTCNNGRLALPSSIPIDEQDDSEEFQKDRQDLLYVGWDWVYQGATRLLWVPPQYKSHRTAVKGDTVALGNNELGVQFIKFDLAKTPLVTGRRAKI